MMAPDTTAGGGAPHVVIIGAGFGGLAAAKALRTAAAQVTIVDRRNHHLFQPLLYQVATAALNPSDIAQPIRRILRRQRNVSVVLGEAAAVDLAARKVVLREEELGYDYLVIATGATHSYFGHDNWERSAPGLKTVEDALEIRRRVLVAYEAAELASDPAIQREWLTFVIVGAGPSGVEMAGALAKSHDALLLDFRRIEPHRARIVLIEAAARVLPAMSAESSSYAYRQLDRLGVEVMTNTAVTGVDDNGVNHASARIAARTVIWAAGVAASPLARSLGAPLDRAGRVGVGPDLTLSGEPRVFVIGDLAALQQDGKPVPGVAAAAMVKGGMRRATSFIRFSGDARPFRYVDKVILPPSAAPRGDRLRTDSPEWIGGGCCGWLSTSSI